MLACSFPVGNHPVMVHGCAPPDSGVDAATAWSSVPSSYPDTAATMMEMDAYILMPPTPNAVLLASLHRRLT